ncbi:putative monocarboxylate transporter [Ixodes scapularis]
MSLSTAASAAGTPSKIKSSKTRPRQEVDTSWHLVAAAALTTCLATVTISNSGFLYVNLMKEFQVNREVASWPECIIIAMCHIAGIIVAVLQRRISIFRISLFGGMLNSIGFIASRFAPDMTWMNVTLGAIHGESF